MADIKYANFFAWWEGIRRNHPTWVKELCLEAWDEAVQGTWAHADIRDEERDKRLHQGELTIVTLCDMVLGENAPDRSDDALIRAVGRLIHARKGNDESII